MSIIHSDGDTIYYLLIIDFVSALIMPKYNFHRINSLGRN